MTVEEYFGDWKRVVDLKEADVLLRKLNNLNVRICPELKNVFKAFTKCSFNNLKVVIIGQDPYNNLVNGKPVATGIAFGNTIETKEENFSPSLGILRESVIDFSKPHKAINFDCSLESWEEQGVLLINASLSCKAGSPRSHFLMWRPFMRSFLANLSKYSSGIVYVLLGSDAQSLEDYIDKNNNHIIKDYHPSYYARNRIKMPSHIWTDINNILMGINSIKIEWFNELI